MDSCFNVQESCEVTLLEDVAVGGYHRCAEAKWGKL